MKIKNFQENKSSISKNRILKRAKLQALLFTDGSLIPDKYQINFANTSKELIEIFCNLVYDVYKHKLPKNSVGKGAGRKQKLYIAQFKSKDICNDLLKDVFGYKTKSVKTFLPKQWFKFSHKELSYVLRSVFDADGGCSLRISWKKKKRCYEIQREVFIACENSHLRNDYKKLLNKLRIKTGESSGKITITNLDSIKLFKNLIGFSKNVHVGYDSKHWQGLEKRNLLNLILNTYSIKRGFIQKFENKEGIYNHIRSLLR